LRAAAEQARIDALLVSCVEDVRYLCGFTGEDSFLLVGRSWAALVTDGRYIEQARRECGDIEVRARADSLVKATAELAKRHKVKRLGVQAENMTLLMRDRLRSELKGGATVSIRDAAASHREVKDADEIKAIRRAIRVAERAFKRLVARGAKGMVGRCERDVAAELDYLMRLEGAGAAAFETIVAAGAHASLPHYRPGATRIRPGQAVLIDWGARVDGYCSDLTRVVFTGTIPRKLAEIHAAVLRAQRAAVGAIRPGATCRKVDAVAREAISRAGYADKFLHGLGHGIGLAVHEGPALAAGCERRLRSGMVLTVEPGIYVPGVGGIRIEDDVLVTGRGRQMLSTLPRALKAMTLT